MQHFIHHLAPTGLPGFVLANGLMSSNQSGEGEIRKHGHVLTPGCYVGAEAAEDDGELFKEKMRRLAGQLNEQFNEGARLDQAIGANLAMLGFPLETQP